MKINILGIETEIREHDFIDNDNALGRWIEKDALILVRKNLPPNVVTETLWHEVIHALLIAIGESEQSNNEDYVNKLSRALMQVATLKVTD